MKTESNHGPTWASDIRTRTLLSGRLHVLVHPYVRVRVQVHLYMYVHEVYTPLINQPCALHKHDMKFVHFMNTVALVMSIVQDLHQRLHNDSSFSQNIGIQFE